MTERLSHSQLNSWATCAERYRLERIVGVPSVPAWNLIGGSTVHEMSERYDFARLGVVKPEHDGNATFEDVFERRTSEAEEQSGFDRSQFRASGRKSAQWPDKENHLWWFANGPAMVKRWVTFTRNCPWDVWIAPDGKPAIELDFVLPLLPDENGVPSLEVKGFIDRVFQTATGDLIVFDLKTGASKQSSNRQLGTYKIGLSQKYGVDAKYGTFWDARSGVTSDVAPLNEYSVERVEWQFGRVREARRLNIFIPNPGPMCSACSVRDSCYEVTPEASASTRPPWVPVDEWSNPEKGKGND